MSVTTPARPLAVVRGILGSLLLVVVITGCGSSGHPAAHKKVASTTVAPTLVYGDQPSALVTMRQFSPESLLWQKVSVTANGTGVLTTLIGEISGAIRKSIQLPPRQAAVLRQLVAAARPVTAPPGSQPRAELYTLHISGKPAVNIQGPTPKPLTALVNFLSGLMLSYCC